MRFYRDEMKTKYILNASNRKSFAMDHKIKADREKSMKKFQKFEWFRNIGISHQFYSFN